MITVLTLDFGRKEITYKANQIRILIIAYTTVHDINLQGFEFRRQKLDTK
jgi:hypothetical protein